MTELNNPLKKLLNRKSYGVHVESQERRVVVIEEPLWLMDRSLENRRPCTYQSLTGSRKERSSASTHSQT